jgi:uncharacterized lipoprotein YajG
MQAPRRGRRVPSTTRIDTDMRRNHFAGLLPLLAAGLLAAGCQAEGAEQTGATEPAAQAARANETPQMVVTVDTQRVERPDIPIVPHEQGAATPE